MIIPNQPQAVDNLPSWGVAARSRGPYGLPGWRSPDAKRSDLRSSSRCPKSGGPLNVEPIRSIVGPRISDRPADSTAPRGAAIGTTPAQPHTPRHQKSGVAPRRFVIDVVVAPYLQPHKKDRHEIVYYETAPIARPQRIGHLVCGISSAPNAAIQWQPLFGLRLT
jgi:hypothetical protein